MPKGLSLHVGLNRVNPDGYSGWPGTLAGCINDANAMYAICQGRGFASQLLLDEQAGSESVLEAIARAASSLVAGDLFVFTYSGHGGVLPDPWGVYRSVSSLCLFDRQVIGHELYELWFTMQPGVRVLVVADSCHSGTVSRDPMTYQPPSDGEIARNLPIGVAEQVYEEHKHLYRIVMRGLTVPDPPCSVLLLGACQDEQTASDGPGHGLFTDRLLRAWNGGQFDGGYHDLHARVAGQMPPYQTPSFFTVGADNPLFLGSVPFTI